MRPSGIELTVFRFVVTLRNFLGGVEVIQFPILTSSHFSWVFGITYQCVDMRRCAKCLCYLQAVYCISCKSLHKVWLINLYSFKLIGNFAKRVNVVWLRDWLPSLSSSSPRCAWTSHHSYQTAAAVATWHNLCRVKGNADIRQTASIRLTDNTIDSIQSVMRCRSIRHFSWTSWILCSSVVGLE